MHEQENVKVIEKLYAAFGSGDVQTILNNVTHNAHWANYGPSTIPYAGDFSGRVLAFFQAIGESTTDGKVHASKFIAQGDTVVALGRYTAKVRATGASIDSPLAHVFTLRDGKVTSWTGYSDSAAVAAAHTGAASSAHH